MIFSDFLISTTRHIKCKICLINFKIYNKILIILKYVKQFMLVYCFKYNRRLVVKHKISYINYNTA